MTSPKPNNLGGNDPAALLPTAGQVRTLADLVEHAEFYAGFCMRMSGSLPPTLFIIGADGSHVLSPERLTNLPDKNFFADVARLFCIGHDARLVVMASEAWAVLPKPGEPLDPMKPPSESPDRQEIVLVIGEERGAQKGVVLPIIRAKSGEFERFGANQALEFDSMKGRFAQFLSAEQPSAEQRAEAINLLRAIGIEPKPQTISPRTAKYRM
ncbi:MAG: hypothetical protein C5B50_05395 [Verrucomicrobia bacterium]|nr:MAG: hypothetical protein C5B50_05395 [Verrucomicrobiota bacterium]